MAYHDLQQRVLQLTSLISRGTNKQHIIVNDDKSIIFCANNGLPEKRYIPEATPLKFHQSDELVRLIMGCYGSGKTTAMIAEIIIRAVTMPICIDGIRRSRCLVIRNTYGELETTTINSWDEWTRGRFEVITRKMKPPITMSYIIRDDKGIIELEMLFLSLNRDDDVAKVKSLETTFAFINESCEIPFGLITHLMGRVGRYPSKNQLHDGVSYWSGIIMDTNPPSTRHPIYDIFERKQEPGYKIFKQPPAILKQEDGTYIVNPNAENISHQPKGGQYYLDMIKGATEEHIKVYAMGQYGIVRSGKLVYPNYNDDLHSIDNIEITQGAQVVVGWDFGTIASAALIAQIVDSRILIIKEFVTDREGFESFASNVVLPYLYINFPGSSFVSIADPSGIAENYTNMNSGIKALNNLNFPTKVAKTNRIKDRLDSVHLFLNKMVVGKPGIVLSRKGCPILREGFLGMYKYRTINVIGDIGERKTREEPDKTHPHSEPQDCLQYICMDYNIFLIDNTRGQISAEDLIPYNNSMWV